MIVRAPTIIREQTVWRYVCK